MWRFAYDRTSPQTQLNRYNCYIPQWSPNRSVIFIKPETGGWIGLFILR